MHDFDRSPEAALLPFFMGRFDEVAPSTRVADSPHRHSFYEILYVTAGGGTQVIDFRSYELRPDTLYLVAPGQVQAWGTHRGIDGWLILFLSEFLPTLAGDHDLLWEPAVLPELHPSAEIRIPAHESRDIGTLVDLMAGEFERRPHGYASMLQAYLHALLIKAQRIRRANRFPLDADPSSALVRRFAQVAVEDVSAKLTVNQAAAKIGVTPGYLASIARRALGKTPSEVIRGALTTEAKRLLTHTELTIGEVAHRLEFSDPSYFGRFFKREAGMSPGAFRRRILAEHRHTG